MLDLESRTRCLIWGISCDELVRGLANISDEKMWAKFYYKRINSCLLERSGLTYV